MPRITDKPRFPQPQTSQIKQDLEKLGDAIQNATNADGEVNLEEVKDRLAGNDTATEALGVIQDEDSFQRTEMRTVSAGCGGGTTTREVEVEPTTLQGHEVQNVLNALIAARGKVEAFDGNADGKLDKGEYDGISDSARGLAEKLATVFADGSTGTYRSEMRKWGEAINDVRTDIKRRGTYESDIVNSAKEHCESMTGADAVAWAYREVLTRTGNNPWYEMDEALSDAETSWLRFIPFFDGGGKGHLNDREVKKHLGTDDLAGFIADKKAAIEARLGGTYEAVFLTGKDLEGHDQISDPDLPPPTSSC